MSLVQVDNSKPRLGVLLLDLPPVAVYRLEPSCEPQVDRTRIAAAITGPCNRPRVCTLLILSLVRSRLWQII